MITGSALLTLTLTAILLPLAVLVAWKCWDLPPVPLRRRWALGWSGMVLAMLIQSWRAEILDNNCQSMIARGCQPERLSMFRWFALSSKHRPYASEQEPGCHQSGDVQPFSNQFRFEDRQFGSRNLNQPRFATNEAEVESVPLDNLAVPDRLTLTACLSRSLSPETVVAVARLFRGNRVESIISIPNRRQHQSQGVGSDSEQTESLAEFEANPLTKKRPARSVACRLARVTALCDPTPVVVCTLQEAEKENGSGD